MLPNSGPIAVLPFADLSEAGNQEFFSDGLTEELLNALAQVPGLRVAARTSSFAFKKRDVPVDSVARTLRVRHILEGSVRKAGDRIKVSAQLVDAASGYHLWSQTFDRERVDVFAVQEEIARAVVDALKVKLASGETIIRAVTANTAAHDTYLRGRFHWSKRTGPDMMKALGLYQRATELDPSYARAHAGLAETYVLLPDYAGAPERETMPKAREAALRALQLHPSLAEAHTALGYVQFRYDWNWKAAEQSFKKAIAANPNYATAHQWYGETLGQVGRFADGETELHRAIELDPLSLIAHTDLAQLLLLARDYDRSIERAEHVISLNPDFAFARTWLWMSYLARQPRADLTKMLEPWAQLFGARAADARVVAHALRDPVRRDTAIRVVDRWRDERLMPRLFLMVVYAQLGASDKALTPIEQSIRDRSVAVPLLKNLPLLDPLRSHPRFRAALQVTGLP